MKKRKIRVPENSQNNHRLHKKHYDFTNNRPVLKRGTVDSRRQTQNWGRLSCWNCSCSVSSVSSSGRSMCATSRGEGMEILEFTCSWLLLPLWNKQDNPWIRRRPTHRWTALLWWVHWEPQVGQESNASCNSSRWICRNPDKVMALNSINMAQNYKWNQKCLSILLSNWCSRNVSRFLQ